MCGCVEQPWNLRRHVIRVFVDFLDESKVAFAVLLRLTVEVAPETVGVSEVQTRCPTILFVFIVTSCFSFFFSRFHRVSRGFHHIGD